MVKPILTYAHQLLSESIEPGELVIDATCGNGNDTLYLAQLVRNEGKVLAFDVQQQAIENTTQLINEHNCSNTTIIHDGHENVNKYLGKEEIIGGAIFNLGYLPGSDKTIITAGDSTISAIQDIGKQLKKHGLIVLVVYHGHNGGKDEKNKLLQYVQNLEQEKYHVLKYEFINQQNNPPFIIAIQKR